MAAVRSSLKAGAPAEVTVEATVARGRVFTPPDVASMVAMSELHWVRTKRGEVCTQGAHVTRYWQVGGDDVLFLSRKSAFREGVPIRGGVPLVFPWFGNYPYGQDQDRRGRPSHGFARRVPWRVLENEDLHGGSARVVLELCSDEATMAMWPHRFRATMTVTFQDTLRLELAVENRDTEAFRFEALLHTYLKVSDARKCALSGLEDAWCFDKTDGNALHREGTGPIRFDGEVDRTFCGSEAVCVLDDPVLRRTITVLKENARSTVVWNPGAARAAELADLGDAFPEFVCVESGNVMDDAVTLPPGERHVLAAVIESSPYR